MNRFTTVRALIGLTAALACGLLPCTTLADVVYNNTTTRVGTIHMLLAQGQVNSEEHGNTVTLADSARAVSQVVLKMRIGDFGAAGFQARMRFYANDGPGSSPGTLLWQSALLFQSIDSGGDTTHFFNVPNIAVPDTFTWTIQVSNRQSSLAPMGPAHYNPPTVGSAPFGYWRRTGPGQTDWEFTGLAEPPFGAQITAVVCRGDWDHNGVINPSDVAAMVSSWFTSIGNPANLTGDADGNGAIEPADVAAFVAAWFADLTSGCGT